MTDNKRKNRFIEEIDMDTPMEMAVKGDDGKWYDTVRKLIGANEAYAKKQAKEKRQSD